MVRSRYEAIFVISFPEAWTRVDRPEIENGRSGNEDLDAGLGNEELDRESVFSHYGLSYKKIVNFRLFFRPAIFNYLTVHF